MNKYSVKQLLTHEGAGQNVHIKGWIRTKRGNKFVNFLALNDGSCLKSIQVVADNERFSEDLMRKVNTGTAVEVKGTLVASQGKGQSVEIQAQDILILGEADAEEYPLQKKKHTMEFLREIAHLRPRTNTFGAIFRIRHTLAFAIHEYFNQKGFFYLHTPIITGSDAEGAGQMFRVTTLDAKNPPLNSEGAVDYNQDFFGKSTNLTVSGQLEGELGAMGLGLVYTFGPTFRAENSNTSRHLAEFWMIEPEMAFHDLKDNMDLAEDFIKYLIKKALERCPDDIQFLNDTYDNALLERLQSVLSNDFVRITYSEAIDILLSSSAYKKGKFEYNVKWGIDLQSEHERYLVEKHFQKPVILSDYPKDIKAFYMRQNNDGKTVAAMDVLFPQIGEIIGGSQREERYENLATRIKEMNIPEHELWWYMDTRKYGTCPHAGFGLGFERLVLFVSGMGNIRDVIPFPRTPQNAEF